MRGSVIKNNFTSGELTPLMYGRSELEPYQKGLAECINMRVLRHGGATRREGTRFVAETKDSTKESRLIPFVFSQTDSVMLEVGNTYIRFLNESGYIMGGIQHVENGVFVNDMTGWTQVNTGSSYTYVNASNEMIMISQGGGIAKVRQLLTGLTIGKTYYTKFGVLTATDVYSQLKIGSSYGATDYTSSPAITGTVNGSWIATATTAYLEIECSITGSNPNQLHLNLVSVENSDDPREVQTLFLEADLFEIMYAQSGDFMWFTHNNYYPQLLKRLSATSFELSDAVIREGPFAPLTLDADNRMRITSATFWTKGTAGLVETEMPSFTSADVGIYVIIYDDDSLTDFQVLQTTSFVNEWEMGVVFPNDIITGLQDTWQEAWAMQAIGAKWGYPAAVSLHDQRLIYAGTTGLTQNVFGSTVAAFDLFSVGVADDDHYNYQLASTKQNSINALAVKHDLIIMTISNEWAMRGGGLEDPITPSNVVTRTYRTEGSKKVQPEEVNDLVIFVQRAGHKLIGLGYDQGTRSLTTNDLSLLAEHLTSTTQIKQVSYQSERESIVWSIDDDGKLLGLTYDASQAVIAWHQHTTGASGEFESVATAPKTDADRSWVIVKRTIDGAVVRSIEYIDETDWRINNDPYYVDSGITYSGVATTSITGLDHLEGESVEVYSSGEYIGDYTVASGAITLAEAVTQAHVGLGYLSRIKELPEGENTQDGSAHTRQKRKPKVDVRLYKTQGIKVNGDIRALPRDASVVKPELFSGIVESSNLGWDYDAQNVIESIGPNPLTVLAIRSTLNVGQE